MKYKTCVSIAENTPRRMNLVLKKALIESEYAELRLDFLDPSQVPHALELAQKSLKRCVCTLRQKKQGGVFTGSEKERISILKLISEYRPFLTDIEFSTISRNTGLAGYVRRAGAQVLVSWHDFEKTPARYKLVKRLARMKGISDYVKIVTTARRPEDTSNILSLYSGTAGRNLIAFAMGDLGRVSRILCLYLGSPYTYTSLGRPTAPGQFSVSDVKKIMSLGGNQSLNQSRVNIVR